MAGAGTQGLRRAGAAGAAVAAVLVWLPGAAQAAPGDPPGGWTLPTFTAQPAATDYADRTVTLAGRLERGGREGGGPQEPAAGATVDLVAGDPSGAGAQLLGTVTTGPGGAFRLPDATIGLRPADAGPGPWTVPVHALHRTPGPGGGAYGSWDAEAEVDVTAVPSAVRLTAAYTLGAPAAQGRTVTAAGLVERAADGGWLPVAGVPVRIGYLPAGGSAPVARTVRTGADGRFAADVTATATGTASTSLAAAEDPYLDASGAAPQTLQVQVAPPDPATATDAPTTPPHRAAPAARHRTAAATATAAARRSDAAPVPSPTAPGATQQPGSLAMTGSGGFTRAAFLTGGSTLIAAGLLLAVARRRIARAAG
ncbi:hypothetical protein [Streptomyces sp. NRRL F-5123]|uniref:hypothetical protein n=1 Tax=Streptomyces sp. NRRL F-5123 TaxID=1463856 RepID=UPI0004E1D7C9|nr:hypothetical protein [Streptomyces sp. NRRL F-5123]